MKQVTVDAKNQALGRLASRVAVLLRGKDSASFEPNELPAVEVTIKNLDKAKFTGSKLDGKVYYRYTGYHGGIRKNTLGELWEKQPKEVIRKMVYSMLPKNKTRDKIIKNLKFQ